jgi:hypothetical protein
MREKMQRIQTRYDGARTPEQFMRVQQRAKSPNLRAKSPFKGQDLNRKSSVLNPRVSYKPNNNRIDVDLQSEQSE